MAVLRCPCRPAWLVPLGGPVFVSPPDQFSLSPDRRVLNTLRYIHANPKAAGVRKGFDGPYSNYGHYGRLEADGISEWHPSFLQLAPTLKECSKRYERFCQRYRHHAKGAPKCHWGSRMLRRLVETRYRSRSKSKRISPGQKQLPFAFDYRLNQIPDDSHQIAVRFRRANGIRDGDRERSIWQLQWGNRCIAGSAEQRVLAML